MATIIDRSAVFVILVLNNLPMVCVDLFTGKVAVPNPTAGWPTACGGDLKIKPVGGPPSAVGTRVESFVL